MSGTFPASPAPKAIRLGSFQPTRVSESHSLRRQTRTTNAQRWILELDFAGMERADMAPIYAFLQKQRGQYDTFQYVLPSPLYTPQGSGANVSPSPHVDGLQVSPTLDVQSGRTIYTKNWAPSTTVLKAMDFLKFASHSKVYMATEDVASDVAGRATIVLDPAVLQNLSNGDAVITHNIPFTVSRGGDEHGFTLGLAQIFELEKVVLVEAF